MKDDANRAYYDEFSHRYEAARRPHDPSGYHAMLDDLEIDMVERYGSGKDVLEAGCGTGLLLERIAGFARSASGFDLSPGMLTKAEARGLSVREGSLTAIPFESASFDVACSFKVLAHVEDIATALREMARVTRPGGIILAEFYNPFSFRGLAKRFAPPGAISEKRDESEVFTRFDPPWRVRALAPAGTRFVAARGVRIVTPMAQALRVPGIGKALMRAEGLLKDTPLAALAGFYIAAYEKRLAV